MGLLSRPKLARNARHLDWEQLSLHSFRFGVSLGSDVVLGQRRMFFFFFPQMLSCRVFPRSMSITGEYGRSVAGRTACAWPRAGRPTCCVPSSGIDYPPFAVRPRMLLSVEREIAGGSSSPRSRPRAHHGPPVLRSVRASRDVTAFSERSRGQCTPPACA